MQYRIPTVHISLLAARHDLFRTGLNDAAYGSEIAPRLPPLHRQRESGRSRNISEQRFSTRREEVQQHVSHKTSYHRL